MYFKVKEGVGDHVEKGVNYTNGEIIETDSNLVEKWPLKFDQCDGVESPQPEQDQTLENAHLSPEEERTPDASDSTPDDPDDASLDMNVDAVKGAPNVTDAEVIDNQILEALCTIESKLGKNVTREFPVAAGVDLVVFQRGKGFRAADSEMPERALHTNKTHEEMVTWLEQEGK